MHRPPATPAPDYTNAFLGTLGLILFLALWTIAALCGTLWVAVTGAALNACIAGLGRLKGR